ncbi:MAG: phosphomethylpyrimidine synthase ThiC, partial [Deltaproteobacteria bacterium]
MTQLSEARAGVVTPEMKIVAEREGVDPQWLKDQVAVGRVVVPHNPSGGRAVPCGVGEGLFVKVNANIGTSSDRADLDEELEKLNASIAAGTDTVMDLSTGGHISKTLETILNASTVPVGTVPIYQAVVETVESEGGLINLSVDKIFEVIEKQASQGVDF